MKKIALIIVIISSVSLGSCKKYYACKCTSVKGIDSTYSTFKDTKKKADQTCEGMAMYNETCETLEKKSFED